MRKNYFILLIVFLLQSISIYAQDYNYIQLSPDLKIFGTENVTSEKSLHAPLGMNTFQSEKYTNSPTRILGKDYSDTLKDHLNRSTSPFCYFYTDPRDNNPYPLTGTNTFYVFLGQRFDITSQASLKGVLIPFAAKFINQQPDSFRIIACSANENTSVPENNIAMADFSMNDIDTSSAGLLYTYFPLPGNASLPHTFEIFTQTLTYSQNPDLVVIWSNTQGDGHLEDRSCFIAVNDHQQTVFAKMSATTFTINQNPLDFDVLILPVIESVNGIDDNFTINGLKFKGIFPNPASDNISFDLSVNNPCDLKFSIISLNGREIKQLRNEYLNAGDYHFMYDISDLVSGNYFFVVKSSKTNFAVNLKIER